MGSAGNFLCSPDEMDGGWSSGGGEVMKKWRLDSHVSGAQTLAPGDGLILETGFSDPGKVESAVE